jgi:uncharacterized membrane protein YphA (DoxX/SURF4 family)
MTELEDRVLAMIFIATGLTGLFGWGMGSIYLDGTTRYIVHGVAVAVYFAILVGVWEAFKRTDTR